MIYLRTVRYAFFSNTLRVFPKIDHVLGHEISLNKCQKIKII